MTYQKPERQGEGAGASRRTILIGFGATGLVLAGALAKFAWPASAANFMELSAILTDRTDLDRAGGFAIYRAMASADPSFPRKVGELVRRLRRGAAGGAEVALREMSDDREDLTAAAQAILAAWYLGAYYSVSGRREISGAPALIRETAFGVLPAPGSCGPDPNQWSASIRRV